MNKALFALAIGAFGIGTTEFIIPGILPSVMAEFAITEDTAGYLTTYYALGVFIAAPLLALLGNRLGQKTILLLAVSFFILGNLLTALAPSFNWAIAGRIITAINHGAFFGFGSIVAVKLVAPNKQASAIAAMFMGLPIANLIGVPLGTWLSQQADWRACFYVITAIGVITWLALWKFIPTLEKPEGVSVRQELVALKNKQIWLAMGITVLGPGGMFAAATYLAPIMLQGAGFASTQMSMIMVVFGLGMVIGNWLGGKFADLALMPMLYCSLTCLMLTLAGFLWIAWQPWFALALVLCLGTFSFASVAPIQRLVMQRAVEAGAPNLASAVNIGMFNLGNAIGAYLGGLVIAFNLPVQNAGLVGAGLASLGLICAILCGLQQAKKPATHYFSNKKALN